MLRLLLMILVMLTFFKERTACAWGVAGHMSIARMAYEHGSDDMRNNVDKISSYIMNDLLSAEIKSKLNRHTQGKAGDFAQSSILADTLKLGDTTVKEYFLSFKANTPDEFKEYEDTPFAKLHFLNLIMPQHLKCDYPKEPHIFQALKSAIVAADKTDDINTLAALLTIITHLVGDAHQPLHVFSEAIPNTQCQKNDRGGSIFCLKSGNNNCGTNLHVFWDRTAGYLNNPYDSEQIAEMLDQYPCTQYKGKEKIYDFDVWIEEGVELYEPIYHNIKQKEEPSAEYIAFTRETSVNRISLAACRLSGILNDTFGNEHVSLLVSKINTVNP